MNDLNKVEHLAETYIRNAIDMGFDLPVVYTSLLRAAQLILATAPTGLHGDLLNTFTIAHKTVVDYVARQSN